MNSSDINHLDDSIINLPCYEPAGSSVSMTIADLMGHTLVTGGSGTGKTTRVIYPMLKQLLEKTASSSETKVGLCIIDTKADGEMIAYLKKACLEAGRLKDLCVIDCDSDYCVDLLDPVKQNGIQGAEVISGLLAALIPESEINRYWEVTFESMLLLALRLYFLTAEIQSYSDMVKFLIRYLLYFDVLNDEFKEALYSLQEDKETKNAAVIEETLAGHRMWKTLDVRTRSVFQSMAAPLLNTLSSKTARKFFSGGKACSVQDATNFGKVFAISVDAIREPTVGALVSTIIKGQFYDSILNRRHRDRNEQRIAGLVMDDWPLCATGGVNNRHSDVSALGMIRSRRGFVIAATQGLSALDLKIGAVSRRAAMGNFSNVFFFRGRDFELDAFASTYLGERRKVLQDRTKPAKEHTSRRQAEALEHERETFVPAVPVGALARLPLGEAFALIGGAVHSQPLCLVPDYAPTLEVEHEQES